MHDINRIKDLQLRQAALTGQYEELDVLLDDLRSLRSKQAFIPEDMTSSITAKLMDVQTDQRSFLTDYNALDFGATPSTITECKTELDDYETYILEKSSYVEVINFLLSLDSDNEAAKSALDQHKAYVAAYDCRTNSVDQCEKDLKKYILLRDAYKENDPTKRLSDIIELSPMIDFSLVVALNTNALFTKEADTLVEAAPYKNSTLIPDLFEDQLDQKTPDTTDKMFASKAPVFAEDLTAPKIPDFIRDLDAIKVPDMTEIPASVPQKPISNRPAPDEAPVPHTGIESGLTAELNYVLSRETAAANLAANVDTASIFSEKTLSEKTPVSKPASNYTANIPQGWEKLGIRNPAHIFYSVSDENMQIFRCARPKKFSTSDFQKEMSLKSPYRFQKQWAIKDAYRYGATTPNMLATLIKEDPDQVEEACNTLVDNGYLKAFELTGPSFQTFEKLYVLTASGRKVFTNADTAAILNLAPSQKPATPPFASHANAVLNRLLFLNTKKLMEIYMPSREFNVGSFILETNSFINFFPTTTGKGTYAYVGVLGEDLKDYLIFNIELQEMLPTLTTINVVGMTKEHAKALTDWIYDSFRDQLTGKKLQLYVQETDTYYSYPQCVPFKVGY